MNFGGLEENVVTREEFPLAKAKEVLKNEVIAVIGYGVQGPAQSLNMRDNGFNVIIGQAPEFKADLSKKDKYLLTIYHILINCRHEVRNHLLMRPRRRQRLDRQTI